MTRGMFAPITGAVSTHTQMPLDAEIPGHGFVLLKKLDGLFIADG